MQIDVFTQLPHAFAWLTEHAPIANVLGGELELRLLNYRDTTPLRAGQIDDEPYGGGAGMILRVDVVAAALDSVYGGPPEHRVLAVTPAGRLLWAPYRLDVTDRLHAGSNRIAVTVTNTPANEHGSAQASGLLGPVVLRPRQELTVRLDR